MLLGVVLPEHQEALVPAECPAYVPYPCGQRTLLGKGLVPERVRHIINWKSRKVHREADKDNRPPVEEDAEFVERKIEQGLDYRFKRKNHKRIKKTHHIRPARLPHADQHTPIECIYSRSMPTKRSISAGRMSPMFAMRKVSMLPSLPGYIVKPLARA